VFEPILRDKKMFRSVRVVEGTIGWENGADIDEDHVAVTQKVWAAGLAGECHLIAESLGRAKPCHPGISISFY
jgi:hypothetical protein